MYFEKTSTRWNQNPTGRNGDAEVLSLILERISDTGKKSRRAMMRKIRHLGFGLIGLGVLILISYMIPPLRGLWPLFRQLPFAIQLGLGAAILGFGLLIVSIIVERIEDRQHDRSLRDDT